MIANDTEMESLKKAVQIQKEDVRKTYEKQQELEVELETKHKKHTAELETHLTKHTLKDDEINNMKQILKQLEETDGEMEGLLKKEKDRANQFLQKID